MNGSAEVDIPGVMPAYFSWGESFEASDGDFVIWADLVIV